MYDVIDLKNDALDTIRSGKVEINLGKKTVCVKGKRVELTPEEYDVALFMVRNHFFKEG